MSIEAMKVEVDEWDACDIKESSFTFVKHSHSKCRHFFRPLGEMIDPSLPSININVSRIFLID